MKLLIDGDVFAWQVHGGVSKIYKEVLPRLARTSDMEMEMLLPDGVPDALQCDKLKVSHYEQMPPNLRPWKFWHMAGPVVNRYLRGVAFAGRNPDVVHSTYYSVPTERGVHVCFVHDLIVELHSQYLDAKYCAAMIKRKRKAIGNSSVIICNSFSTKQDLERVYDVKDKPCYVAYLAGRGERVHKSECRRMHGEPFLLYVGDTVSRYKNFEFILKCLSQDRESSLRELRLAAVTSSRPSQDLLEGYYKILPRERLLFITDCSDARLDQLYSECIAFVYPSFSEGFGIPIIEALEHGAPVLCSDIDVFQEVAAEEAYYFDPHSEDDFRISLHEAIQDGRNKEAVTKRKRHARKYSWDKTAAVFLDAFHAGFNMVS